MSESTNGPDRPDSSGVDEPSRNFLDNPQIYDLFKSAIQKELDATVHQRFEAARNRAAIVWTAVGTIITLLIVAVPTFGWSWLDARINTTIERRIDQAVGYDIQVAALNFHVLRIQTEGTFRDDAAELIIDTIGALYAERDDAESRDKLIFAVDTMVENFVLTRRLDLVIRLEEKASELFRDNNNFLEIMISAQGLRLLGDAGAPGSWLNETGSMRTTYESYRFYADKGRFAGYPENYTAYELLLGHLEGWKEEKLENLIADAENLNEGDQTRFVTIMSILAEGEWTQRPNAESDRVIRNVETFLCKFRQESFIIKVISDNAELQCP